MGGGVSTEIITFPEPERRPEGTVEGNNPVKKECHVCAKERVRDFREKIQWAAIAVLGGALAFNYAGDAFHRKESGANIKHLDEHAHDHEDRLKKLENKGDRFDKILKQVKDIKDIVTDEK